MLNIGSLHRFLGRFEGDFGIIEGGEYHHLKRVLRMKLGDKLRVFDGKREYLAEIVSFERDVAKVKILQELPKLLPPIELTVAVSPPKGTRFDDLIEKLVEIGVSRIIPTICERTVKRPKEKKDRWERIMISAVKQCGRSDIPEITEPKPLEEVLSISGDFDKKLAGLIGSEKYIYDADYGRKTIILIGPEGDFTDEEKENIIKSGFEGFSLGGIILRVETAALVSSSFILQKAWKYEGSNNRQG